jgi:hypothetical protein
LQLRYTQSNSKDIRFYRQLIDLYPPDQYKDVFRGELKMLPIFMNNPCLSKNLVIENINGYGTMLEQGPSKNTTTKYFEMYYRRNFHYNE